MSRTWAIAFGWSSARAARQLTSTEDTTCRWWDCRPPRRRRHLCAIYRLLSFCLFSISEEAESCAVEHFIYLPRACICGHHWPVCPPGSRAAAAAAVLCTVVIVYSGTTAVQPVGLPGASITGLREEYGRRRRRRFIIDNLGVESRMLLNIGDTVCEYN